MPHGQGYAGSEYAGRSWHSQWGCVCAAADQQGCMSFVLGQAPAGPEGLSHGCSGEILPVFALFSSLRQFVPCFSIVFAAV